MSIVVTRLSREGSNLISRDTTLATAAAVMTSMSARPVDFANGSKVIFSVLKKGATTGTANYDKLVMYQRAEFGTFLGPGPQPRAELGRGVRRASRLHGRQLR